MDTPRRYNRRNPEKKRRPSTLTIPDRVPPHVRLVFSEMQRQNVRYDDVEVGSGVLRTTLKAWRNKNRPGLESMEAVLGFLGWDFVPLPRERALPPSIVAELQPIAERLAMTMPTTIVALLDILAIQRLEAAPPTAADPEPLVRADDMQSAAEKIGCACGLPAGG